ncbi:MAG: hypothetical protein ACLT8E_11440 [Akkermansia sp.]
MTVSTTLKYFFLPCLLAAAVPLRAAPPPCRPLPPNLHGSGRMATARATEELGILSFGVFPKEIVVFNEGSIFAKKNSR